MHVTCIAHLIHSCAMRARTHFKEIDNLVTSLKAATIKNKDRQNDSREPGLPAPPRSSSHRMVNLVENWFLL